MSKVTGDIREAWERLLLQLKGMGGKKLIRISIPYVIAAYIGYIWYEAPEDEQNFSTLIEMIDLSETREEDEGYENVIDIGYIIRHHKSACLLSAFHNNNTAFHVITVFRCLFVSDTGFRNINFIFSTDEMGIQG